MSVLGVVFVVAVCILVALAFSHRDVWPPDDP